MNIPKNGIFFKQSDRKIDGEYISDGKGGIIHQEYKKPTIWQKAKYLAKNGYEFEENTLITSCLWFYPEENLVCMGSMASDAITTAKNYRNKQPYNSTYKYSSDKNIINFETDYAYFRLIISENGDHLTKYTITKKDKKTLPPIIFSFLNWDII